MYCSGMNKHQFAQNNLRKLFRLRPVPYRVTMAGEWLDSVDYQWECSEIKNEFVQLTNISTGHFVNLGYDHVREYLSPDMLILKSQITLHGPRLYVEPLPFYLPRTHSGRN
jgi:hypothetical protein